MFVVIRWCFENRFINKCTITVLLWLYYTIKKKIKLPNPNIYWPFFVYCTFVNDTFCPCLSRIKTLTLNATVERVSTGLDDGSVFTGLFYRKNNKIGPKSRSVIGFNRLRFVIFFTKNNMEKIRDYGNRSVSAGVRFYQGTVWAEWTVILYCMYCLYFSLLAVTASGLFLSVHAVVKARLKRLWHGCHNSADYADCHWEL